MKKPLCRWLKDVFLSANGMNGGGGAIALPCGGGVRRLEAEIGPVGEINVRLLLTDPRLITLTGSTQGKDPPISDV